MKKFIFVLAALLFSATAFAQLNITSTSSRAEQFYHDQWITESWNGSAFIATSSDPVTALSLTFTLGADKASALTTLQQISKWFKGADSKSSITFEDNGKQITLYKQDNLQIIISTGDPEFIRKEYTRRLSGALIGTVQYKKKESTPHFSFITKNALEKMIWNTYTITDPKYIKGDPNSDPYIRKLHEREKKYSDAKAVVDSTSARMTELKSLVKEAKKDGDADKAQALKEELDRTTEINKQAKQTIKQFENGEL